MLTSPAVRRRQQEALSAYTPALVLHELEVMGGTLTVQDGVTKLENTGHASSLWHMAFARHRAEIIALYEKKATHKENQS